MDTKLNVKNMGALKEFAKFYENYAVLDFKIPNFFDLHQKEYENNVNILYESVQHLSVLLKEADETETGSITPATFIIFQVVAHKLISKKKFDEVLLNLKSWQDIAKLDASNKELVAILSSFTGYK